MGLKTGDLDLDLQGQNGLETFKFCMIPCECKLLNQGILQTWKRFVLNF